MSRLLSYNATLVQRVDRTPTLGIFRVRPDRPIVRAGSGEPGFLPGQYVRVGLNAERARDLGPQSVIRPLSIASAPEEPDIIELYVNRVEEPESPLPFTHLLWALEPSARLHVHAVAAGRFTIRDTVGDQDSRALLLVAAGTGIAPFMSIIRSRARGDPGAGLAGIAIVHGVSRPSSLAFHEELEALRVGRGLRYLPTLSRPEEVPPGWTGGIGRADQILRPNRIAETEERLGLSIVPGRTAAFVCGLHGTVRETIVHLLARGFVPDHHRLRRALDIPDELPSSLFFEKYDTAPVIDTRDQALMAALSVSFRRGTR